MRPNLGGDSPGLCFQAERLNSNVTASGLSLIAEFSVHKLTVCVSV